MKLYIKYDIKAACEKMLQEQLDKLELDYEITGFGEVDIKEAISSKKLEQLTIGLNNYGSEIVESHKSILIQKIKDAIVEMVYMEEKLPSSKTSFYLAQKTGHSYNYISNVFSHITYTSIVNFIILQKIERAKQLIISNELTATEIAWKLNYSSVAHFGNQFKNITGLTPRTFQRIINKRRTIPQPDTLK